MIAIDPDIMGSKEEFIDNVSRLVEKVTSSKKLERVSTIHAPGQRGSQTTTKNIQTGEIEVEDNLLKELQKIAQKN